MCLTYHSAIGCATATLAYIAFGLSIFSSEVQFCLLLPVSEISRKASLYRWMALSRSDNGKNTSEKLVMIPLL